MAATFQRGMRLRHRRALGYGSDEYVAPYESSDIMGGDTEHGSSASGIADTDTSFDLPLSIPYVSVPPDPTGATVSVQDLQQQYSQGVFSNPRVPPQYSAVTPPSQETGDQYVGPAGAALTEAETNAFKAWALFGSNPLSTGAVPSNVAVQPTAPSIVQPANGTSLAATSPAASSSDWLSNLMTWLQSPISSSITIPWYMAIVAAAAALYLMREEN